jgi:DNA-binding NtrC family response regulator
MVVGPDGVLTSDVNARTAQNRVLASFRRLGVLLARVDPLQRWKLSKTPSADGIRVLIVTSVIEAPTSPRYCGQVTDALQLAELLDFRPDQGIIRLHDQRVVILSAAAMGLLRKELIGTLGIETARRLMLRFGFADGYHDAVSLRDRSSTADPVQAFRTGTVVHSLEGIVRHDLISVEFDEATGRFEAHEEWHDSYVAEQHVLHYGKTDRPVCWSLTGYASGFASACFAHEIYFQETSCLAEGKKVCSAVGKDAASWGADVESLRLDFHGADLGREVVRLQTAVRKQMQELAKRERHIEQRERELDVLRERIARHTESKHFIARSAAMQEVLELAARVAPIDTTVLVYGESGTGKEFIVRMIHDQSSRASAPFVSVNCAALTESLLESELFGHVRGAFTGATRDKAGLFEVAGSGTLFLDEIGEVAPTVQAKLLRALQEHEIRRVGAERTIKVNARVVAATNRNLKDAVANGAFREDLYFRLGAFVITVPPLRDRREDIPALVHEFVRRSRIRVKKDVKTVSAEAMTALINYEWPGNVRELEHAIERAVILAHGTSVTVRELPPEVSQRKRSATTTGDPLNLRSQERDLIRRALERYKGNRKRAAEALHISTVTLWRKMKEYDLRT